VRSRPSTTPTTTPTGRNQSHTIPEREHESWRASGNAPPPRRLVPNPIEMCNLVPSGGTIRLNGVSYVLSNTCNFDSVLQVLYCLLNTHPTAKAYIQKLSQSNVQKAATVLTIYKHLTNGNYDAAKVVTVLNLLDLTTDKFNDGNMYGSEERFLNKIAHFIGIVQSSSCTNANCPLEKSDTVYPMKDMILQTPNDAVNIFNSGVTGDCQGCSSKNVNTAYKWTSSGAPPFFVFPITNTRDVSEKEISFSQEFMRVSFNLFAYTVHLNDHFQAVIIWGKKKYLYNGSTEPVLSPHKQFNQDHRVSTVWYTKQ